MSKIYNYEYQIQNKNVYRSYSKDIITNINYESKKVAYCYILLKKQIKAICYHI